MFLGWCKDYVYFKDWKWFLLVNNKRPTASSLVEFFRAWAFLCEKVFTTPSISLLALGIFILGIFFPAGALVMGELWCCKKIRKEVWTAEKEWVRDGGRNEGHCLKTGFIDLLGVRWQRGLWWRRKSPGWESLRQQSQCPLWRYQGFCWAVVSVYKVLTQAPFHSLRTLHPPVTGSRDAS